MRLYFLRHAEAVDGFDDAARELSAHGREQCRHLGHWLRTAGVTFDAVYTSPLVRARQTAEGVLKAAGLAKGPAPVEQAALLNESSAAACTRWLPSLLTHKHVLLVGHAPSLAERVRWLLDIRHPEAFDMPKASLACVATDDARSGTLKFFVTPKLFSR